MMEVIDYIGTSIDTFLNMDDEVPLAVKFKCTIKLDLRSKFLEIIDEKIDEDDRK
jgi:hypothetical protein